MQLLERGRCVFATGILSSPINTVIDAIHVILGGLTPPSEDLLLSELGDNAPNILRFEHYQKSSGIIRYVESKLHLWSANESVVVADLDGTLTISDVEGHIRTLRLGQYDYLHKGACEFFLKLHELKMRILYLTARPIDWASGSRNHLENAKQHTHQLPPGPLITNWNGLTGALITEVVNKNPHIFKTQVMNEIQLCMIHAGRTSNHPIFIAGFGNRMTDVTAYQEVGIEKCMIFLIDPNSSLKAFSDPRVYDSYQDPNVLLWLLPRLKHKVSIELLEKIDAYTARELVLADERQQLIMAERLVQLDVVDSPKRNRTRRLSMRNPLSRSSSGV
jgi:phosphatidate phosphatase LPIN